MRPQINVEFASLNTAWIVAYQGRFGSNFGSFPLSRIGSGLQYYPAGLPLQRTVLDNGVVVNENKFSPFVMGQMQLAAVAVTDTSAQGQSFNALTVGYQVGAGGELPIAPNKSLVAEFIIDGTLSGSASGDPTTAVTLRAYSVMLGLSIRP